MNERDLTVLVVDDSALMRKALKAMLSDAGGFVVHLARNGQDALDQIPRIRPDVVTLDINMPEMDGLTCLSTIMREHPLPVVMVSSLTEKGALVTLEALELGAVDYVEKPGGTVSMNMAEVSRELVGKVRSAARARARVGGLRSRLKRADELAAVPAGTASSRSEVAAARSASGQAAELVIVGASTGGPGLLADLLSRLPADTRSSVLVAQHMPQSFTGALARRLDGCCPLPVQEVTLPTPLRPGRVYVARGDADLVVSRRPDGLIVRPMPASPEHRWHPSVDRLVESALATLDPKRLVGVLLTGMGDDGATQMTLMRQRGGRTIAESEQSAVVWGMPGQLVAKGGATLVLDAENIPPALTNWM